MKVRSRIDITCLKCDSQRFAVWLDRIKPQNKMTLRCCNCNEKIIFVVGKNHGEN